MSSVSIGVCSGSFFLLGEFVDDECRFIFRGGSSVTSSMVSEPGPTPPLTPHGYERNPLYMQSSATVDPYVAGHAMNQKLDQLLLLVGEQMSKTTEMKEEIATLKTDVMTIKKKQEEKREVSISKKKTPKLPTDLCVSCWSPCVCSVQHIQNFTVW